MVVPTELSDTQWQRTLSTACDTYYRIRVHEYQCNHRCEHPFFHRSLDADVLRIVPIGPSKKLARQGTSYQVEGNQNPHQRIVPLQLLPAAHLQGLPGVVVVPHVFPW